MNQYPINNVVICRFGFLPRALTQVETATFISTGQLPANLTGIDPYNVYFDYLPPGGPAVTLTYSALTPPGNGVITRDSAGAYHVPLIGSVAGVWSYRGRGLDTYDNPLTDTGDHKFTIIAPAF